MQVCGDPFHFPARADGRPADVLILNMGSALKAELHGLGADLVCAGITVEIPMSETRISEQFKHADYAGVPIVLIMGHAERFAGVVRIKDLRKHDPHDTSTNESMVPRDRVVHAVAKLLRGDA